MRVEKISGVIPPPAVNKFQSQHTVLSEQREGRFPYSEFLVPIDTISVIKSARRSVARVAREENNTSQQTAPKVMNEK